jgi:hypothetical protein
MLRDYASKIKVKLFCCTECRAEGERRYRSYSFLTLALDGVSGQRNASAALYSQGKDPLYPLDRRLGGHHSWSGHRD